MSPAMARARPAGTQTLHNSDSLERMLRRKFKKPGFRPRQLEVIEAALEGQDVFLQAATSFGKSICFQLPAIVNSGLTIVISPLLALMANQVTALKDSGIRVESLNGNTPKAVKKMIFDDLKRGHPKIRLLYVTPERCKYDDFRNNLRAAHHHGQLARIVIDEAHCISEWGHDFRTAFQELSFFRNDPEFSSVPIFCCTATATEEVRSNIISTLQLDSNKLKKVIMSSIRSNLHFEVRYQSHEEEPFEDFTKWIKQIYKRREEQGRSLQLQRIGERITNVSGIIYIPSTSSREACEDLANRLTLEGINAKPYHAKLLDSIKDDNLKGWVNNEPGYDIIIATTAFGMGIDKPDVRFVVHWGLPKSFEGFYQEAGRAGRDGRASATLLYYNRKDRDRRRVFMERDLFSKQERLRTATNLGGEKLENARLAVHFAEQRAKSQESLISYAENTDRCRHQLIASFFGDKEPISCDWACDWHKDSVKLKKYKQEKLDDEEFCQTQIQMGTYDEMNLG